MHHKFTAGTWRVPLLLKIDESTHTQADMQMHAHTHTYWQSGGREVVRGELLQALRVYKAKVKIVDKSNAKSFYSSGDNDTNNNNDGSNSGRIGRSASSALPRFPTPPPSSYAAILSAYFCHCNAISDVAVADFHGQI